MPTNPNKTRCSVAGCRAWARRGSDPPRCAAHSGLCGAPPGNQNHLIHGFYASSPRPEELADLVDSAGTPTLDAEIAIVRVALRRIVRMLLTGLTLGADPQPLDAQDYGRFADLTFRGASTLARLLRARHALGGDKDDRFVTFMDQVLDELSEEWGVQL